MPSHAEEPARLPRRDLWLLPGIAALTVLVLLGGAEILARLIWPQQRDDRCEVQDRVGEHFRPNCHSRVKLAEGPWVDYRFNACGYRSAFPCGAKPAGSLRVAVLGSSISRGYWVAYSESFAGRLEQDLARRCHRPVDFQSLAIAELESPSGPLWHTIADRTGMAIALHPDAIVMVLAPFDLEKYQSAPDDPAPRPLAPPPSLRDAAMGWFRAHVFGVSRAVLAAQHFFYLDLDRYIPLYLAHGDAADFLRPPFSPAWRMRLHVADRTLGRMADQARAAHVDLVIVFMPSRADAALAAEPKQTAGVDPFALGQALAGIAARHGALFVDVTQAMRAVPGGVNRLYYPVDGHPNGQGHGVLAASLEQALVTEVPAFAGCRGS